MFTASRKPTYGELIDLLSDAERKCDKENVPEVLYHEFTQQYPHIYVGRPKRLYDTVARIAAPTRPSLRGETKLIGSPLSSYRKRKWIPRIRNAVEGEYCLFCSDCLITVSFKM